MIVNVQVAELQNPDEFGPDSERFDEKNIRRRVYDALNVLMAMNIIAKEKKACAKLFVAKSPLSLLLLACQALHHSPTTAGAFQLLHLKHAVHPLWLMMLRLIKRRQEIIWKGLPAMETDEEHMRGEKIRIATRIERKKAYLQVRVCAFSRGPLSPAAPPESEAPLQRRCDTGASRLTL